LQSAYYIGLVHARQACSCPSTGSLPDRMTKMKKRKARPEVKHPAPQHATAKPISASRSEMVEAVLPNDANPLGNMLGGRVMFLIDIAGALAAHRPYQHHKVIGAGDHVD